MAPKMPKIKKQAVVPTSEFSDAFVQRMFDKFFQGMYDRMAVSFFKYDKVEKAYPDKVNALASMDQRIIRYRDTRNTEFLIDAANFLMIEFMRPSLTDAHFTPTDSHESPGRTKNDGTITTRGNLDIT